MPTLGIVSDLTKPPGCGCKHCLGAARSVLPSSSRRSRLKPGTIKLFKEFTRALEPKSARLSHKIDFSKLGEQPEVHLTYRHLASTTPAEHGRDQVLCKLKLEGNVTDEVLRRQAAQLLCHESYHRYRNQKLEALVEWFDKKHPTVLSEELMKQFVMATSVTTANTPKQKLSKAGAVKTFALEQLSMIANVLIPEEAEKLIGMCRVIPKPTYDQMATKRQKMSEIELMEMRIAEAQATGKLQMTAKAATSKDADSTSATAHGAADQSQTSGAATESREAESASAANSPVGAIQGADEKAAVKTKPSKSPSTIYEKNILVPEALQRTVQETTVLMLDALLAWCDRDASYRQDQRMKIAAMATDLKGMESATEALAKRLNVKLEYKPWQESTTADMEVIERDVPVALAVDADKSKNLRPEDGLALFQQAIPFKRYLLEIARRIQFTWGQLADKAADTTLEGEYKRTSTSAGGLLMTSHIHCTASGPSIPLMLSQVSSADFMKGFSSAGTPFRDRFPSLDETSLVKWHNGEGTYPDQMFAIMAQYIQLRHIDSFHCTLPKDPPPTPKRLLRRPSTKGSDEALKGLAQTATILSSSSTDKAKDLAELESNVSASVQKAKAASKVGGKDSISISVPPTADAFATLSAAQANAGATSSSTKSPSSSSPSSSGGNKQDAGPSNSSGSSNVSASDDSSSSSSSSSSSRLVDSADRRAAVVSDGESVKANGRADGSQQLPLARQEALGGDMSLTGSVEKSAFEFGGGSLQLKQLVDAMQQYVSSTGHRSMQWIPAGAPVSLQRWDLPGRVSESKVWHNLQVAGSFRSKEGEEVTPGQGPRSRYIKDLVSCRHLTALTDCLDQYIQKQWNPDTILAPMPHLVRPRRQALPVTAGKDIILAEVYHLVRPKWQALPVTAGKFAAKWLGYAALATIVVAPFLAAFRSSTSAAHRRRAIVAEPAHAMVLTADQFQAVGQTESMEADVEASNASGYAAVNAHLSEDQLSVLCEKLQQKLQAPAQVRLGNTHANVIGHPAEFQVVVDSSGEVYGCWPVNGPAVSLWSSMPATAQLRSASYQHQYQNWLQRLSAAAEAGKSEEIAPPAASAIVSKPAPDKPVVLRMTVLIDHHSNLPADEPKTDLGQLSILDDASNIDQTAQLISAELQNILRTEARLEGDSGAAGVSNGEAPVTDGEQARPQELFTGSDKQHKSQATVSQRKRKPGTAAVTHFCAWTDQDSQHLWI